MAEWNVEDDIVDREHSEDRTELAFEMILSCDSDDKIDYSNTDFLKAQFCLVSIVENDVVKLDLFDGQLNVLPTTPEVIDISRTHDFASDKGPLDLRAYDGKLNLKFLFKQNF